MRRAIVTTVLAAVLSIAGAATAAAQDAFLWVPNIPGAATQEGYRDWIDIYSLSQSATDEKASGGCAVHLTKALDQAGPRLWAATVTGQTLGEVKVHLVQPQGGSGPRLLYDLVLTQARVTSISTDASAGGGASEQVRISGNSATLTYHAYTAAGVDVPVSSTITCGR